MLKITKTENGVIVKEYQWGPLIGGLILLGVLIFSIMSNTLNGYYATAKFDFSPILFLLIITWMLLYGKKQVTVDNKTQKITLSSRPFFLKREQVFNFIDIESLELKETVISSTYRNRTMSTAGHKIAIKISEVETTLFEDQDILPLLDVWFKGASVREACEIISSASGIKLARVNLAAESESAAERAQTKKGAKNLAIGMALVIGLSSLFFGVSFIYKNYQITKWNIVNGYITSSAIINYTPNHFGSRTTLSHAAINYSYIINETNYTGKCCISSSEGLFNSGLSEAQKMVKDYSVGQTTKIYVNPSNFSESRMVADIQTPTEFKILIGMGAILIVIGGLSFFGIIS